MSQIPDKLKKLTAMAKAPQAAFLRHPPR